MIKNIRSGLYFLLVAGIAIIFVNSCRKDDDNSPVIDIDGNVYHTVTIGKQVWMVENLKTTKYRNGDLIPNITDAASWQNSSIGAYCNYINNEAFGDHFGRLYNWGVVTDSRKIAPKGWHVPTDDDWAALLKYVGYSVGMSEAQSLSAKSDWKEANTGGEPGWDLATNNFSGFTALPGGYREWNGLFRYVGEAGKWWSSSYSAGNSPKYKELINYSITMNTKGTSGNGGLSIRCIKD